MTTLTPDELQRQQLAICEAVYRCYPRSLIKVLPMWIASNAPEQIWSCTRTDLDTGETTAVRHLSYTEALCYWNMELRLLNSPQFLEALKLIEQPITDENGNWFGDAGLSASAGDMG